MLSETVAREVVKDLVRGDVCRQLLKIKDENIKNLQEQNDELVEIIKIKNNILSKKDELITVQNKAIGWWEKPQLNGYLRVQTINNNLVEPFLFGVLLLEFPKINIGAQYFIQPNNPPGYGLTFEYKLF